MRIKLYSHVFSANEEKDIKKEKNRFIGNNKTRNTTIKRQPNLQINEP